MASIQGEGQTKFTIKVDHKEVDEAISKLKQLDSTVKNIKSMASDIKFHFDMGSLKTFDVKKLKNFSDFFEDLRDPRLSSFDSITQSFQGYNEQLAAFAENLKTIKTGKTIDLNVKGMDKFQSLKDFFGDSLFENTKTKVDPNDKLSKNYLDNLKKNLTNKDQVKEFDSLVKDYNEQLKYYENESEFVKSGNSTIRKNTLEAIEDYKTGKETLEKAITEAVQFDSDWQKRLLKEDANFDLSTRLDLDNDDSRNFETLFDNINFKFEKYYESIAKLEKIQSSTDNGKLLGKIFGKDKEKIDEVQSIFNGIDDNKKWLFDYSKGLINDGEKYSELTRKAFDAYINQDYFGDGFYNNLFKDEEFKDELESKYTYNDDKTLMGFKRKLNKSKKKLKEYINDNFTESQQNKADAEDINTKDVTIKVNFEIGEDSRNAVDEYLNNYSDTPIIKTIKLELDKGQQGDGTDSINSTLSEFIDSQIKRMEVAGKTLTGIQKKFVDNKDSFALTVEDQNSPAVKRKNTEIVYNDLLKDNEEYQRIKSEIKEITDIYGKEPKFVPDKEPLRFDALKKIAEDLIAPASTKGLKPEQIEEQTIAQAKQIFSTLGTNAKEYLETRSGAIHDLIQKFSKGEGKELRVTNKKTGQMQDVSEDDFYTMLTNKVNDILESKAYQDSFVGGKVTGKANKYGISSKSGWLNEIKSLDKKISASDRKKEVADSAQAAEEAKERYNQLIAMQKKIREETFATAKADVEKMTLENPISQINNLVGEKQTVNLEVKVNPEDPFASLRQAISSIEGKPVTIQVESKPIKEAALQAAGKQEAESIPQEEVQTEPTPVDVTFKPVEGSAETLHSEIQSYFSGNPITVSFKPESVSKENVGEQVAESVKDDVEESITDTVKVPTASWMKAYAAERSSTIEMFRKDAVSDIKFPSLKQNLEEMFYGPSKKSYADKSVRDFYSESVEENIFQLGNKFRFNPALRSLAKKEPYTLEDDFYNYLTTTLEAISSISGSQTSGILRGKMPDDLAKFLSSYSKELDTAYKNREENSDPAYWFLKDVKKAFELVHNSNNYRKELGLKKTDKPGRLTPYGFHKNYPNYEKLKANNKNYKKNSELNDEAYEQAYQQWQESKEQVINDFARETGFFADVDKNVERRMTMWERENPPQYTEKQIQISKPKQQSKPKETKQTEKSNDLLSELQSQVDNAKPVELSVVYKPADNALSDLTSSAEGGEPISVPVKFKAAEDASGELQSALDGYSDLRVKVRFEPADDASGTLQSQLDGYADLKAKVRLEPSEDAANLLQTNLDGLTPVPVKVELKPVDNALQSVAEQYGESDAVPIPVSFKSAKQSKEETEVPSDHETTPVPVTFEPAPGAVDNLISQVKSAGPAKMEAEQASKTAYDNSVSQQRRILEESGKFDTASNPAGWTPKVYEDIVNAFSTPVPITFNYAEELAKIRSVIEEACSNIPITFDDSALNTSLSDTVEKLGKESLTESLSKLLTKEMMAEAKKQADNVTKEKLKEEKAQKKVEEKAAKEAENKRLEDEQIQRMTETLKARERTENEKPEKAESSEQVNTSAEALKSAATSVNEAASSMESAANAVTEKEKATETKTAESTVKSEPEQSKTVEAKSAEVTSTPAVDISNAGTVNVNAGNVKGNSESTTSAIDNLSIDDKRRLYYDHLSNLLQERFGDDTKVSVKENGVYVYDKTLNDDNSKTESVRIYSGDLSRLTDTATGKLVDNIGDLILTEKWNKSPQSTAEKNRRAREAREAEMASGGGAKKEEKIRPDVASILNDLKALEGINPSSILFGDDRLNFSVTREENGAVQEHKYYIPRLSKHLTDEGKLLEGTLLEGDGWPYSTAIKAFTEAPLETTPIFRNLITDESMSTNEMRMMAAQLVAENMPGILKDSIKFGNGFKLDFESAVLDQNGQWAIFKNQIADLRQILQSHAEGTLNNDLMPALLTSSEFTGFRNAPESTRAMSQYLADLPNGEQLLIAAQNYLNAVETLKQAEAALGQYGTKENIADDAVDRAIDRIDNQRKVVEKAKEAMDSQVNALPEEEKGKAQNYLGQVLKGRAKSGALNAQQMASLSKNMSDFAEMYNFAMDESNFTGDYYTTAWNSKFDSKTKMTRKQAIAKLAEEYSQISNDLMENLYVTDEDRAFAKARLKELKDRMTQGILNDPSKVRETGTHLQDIAKEEVKNEREIRQKVRDYYKQNYDASDIQVGRIKDGKVSASMRQGKEYVEKLVSTQNLTNEKGQDVLRMEEISSSSERWQSGWEKWGHSIAGKLKTLGAYFGGLRLIQTGMNEISSGFEFVKTMDSALTNINMTMGVSKKELSQLGQQAIKTGIDLSTDATNVIQAATIYANANETADSVLEKAKPTVLLSNASGVDASTSAQQIQAVVQQFGDLKGQETRIVNSYEKISAGLAIDFADGINIMAEAVQNAGSIADASGLSFETFAAIVGKVSEKTRQEGTVIGNAMKSIMARISRSKSADEDVSDEDRSNAAKAYSSVGIHLYNDKGEYQNLSTTLDMLSSKWNTLTDAQKNYIAEQSAGTRGINTFNVMMETLAEAKELAKQAVDDPTFYEGVQETWEGSVAGHQQKIEAQKEQLYSRLLNSGMLETGMGLLNGILDVINMIAGAASTINDFLFGWNDSLSKAVTSAASLLAAVTAFDIGKALIKGDDRSFAINMLAAIKNGISPNGPNAGGEWFGGFRNYMSKGPSGILEDVKNTRLGKILTPDYKKKAKQEAETAAIEAETAKTEAKTATVKAETAQKESTVISQPSVTKTESNIATTPEPKTEVSKPNVEAPMPAVNVNANKQAIKATEEVAESAVKAAEETSALSTAVDSVANVSAGAAVGASKIAEAGAEVASTAGAAAKSGGKLASLKTGAKNFLAAAWPMLAIAGVSAGVSWYLNKKKQDKETVNNYASDSNSNIQSFLSGKSEVQSLIQEYTALSKGVDTLTGKNISLTNDEFERYLSLTSQIAERFPSLVDGFDASGNAILRYGTTVSGLNDEIEKSGLETAKNNLKSESLVLQQAENTFKRFSLDRTYDINNDADGTPNVDYSTYQKYLNIKEGMKGLDYSNLNEWFKDNQYASWVKDNYKLSENSSKKAFDSAVQQMKKDMAGYYSDMATDMNNYRSVLVNEAMLERYSNPSIKGLIDNDTWDSLTSFLSKANAEQLSDISTNNISPEDFIKGITDAMTKRPNAKQTRDAFDALFSLNGSSSLSDLSQFMTKNAMFLKDIKGFNLEGALSSLGQDNVEKRLKMAEKDFKDFQNHQVKTALATKPREGKADGSDAKEIEKLNKAYKDLTNASKKTNLSNLYKDSNDYLKKTGKELKNQVNNLSDWNKLLSKLGVTTEADLEKLHDQLKKYKYDLDAMVDKWNTDTYDFNREEERIASLVSQAEAIGNAFKYMHDAFAQSNTVNGLTPEWVKSIDNMFSELEEYNYDDLWESTTMGIRANSEEFTKCMAAWRRLKEEGYEAEVRRISDAYADLARQIANAGTESEKAALSKELLQTKDQLDRAIEAKSLFYGQTNEAARWQMAYSSKSEKGNLFASLTGDNGGYASAEKLYKGHDIGTQEFRSFVDLISYDDYSDADVTSLVKKYESSKAALNRWLVEDTSAGIENFLEDMQRANPGLARLEGDQWKINTGGYSFDEIAKMMDISTPFLQMISDAMSDKGFHVPVNDVSDDLYEIRDKAKSGAEKIRQSIESQTGQPYELNFDYGTDKLEDVEKQLNTLHELGELHPELKDGDLKKAYDDLEDYFLTKKGEIEAESWTPEGLKESTEKGLKEFKKKYKKNLSSDFDPEFSSDLESYYDEQIRQMREATFAGGKVLVNDKNYADQRNAVEAIIDSKLNSRDDYGWVSQDSYKNSTAKIAENLSNASKQYEKVNLLNDIVELDPSEMSKAQQTLNKQISDLFAPENATALNQLRDAGNFNIEDLLPKDTDLRNSLDSLYDSVKDNKFFKNNFGLEKGFDKTDMLGAILGMSKKKAEKLFEKKELNADLLNNLYKALGLSEDNSGTTAQGKNVQTQVKPVIKADQSSIKKMQEDLNKSLKAGDGLNLAADIEITDNSLKKACEKTKDFAGANEQIVSEIIADPTRYQGAGKNEQIAYVKFLADQSSIQEVCKEVENSNPEAVAHIVADPTQYNNYTPEDQQAYVKILAKSEDIQKVCSEIEGSNPEILAQIVADPTSVNEIENISIPDLQATVQYLSDMGALEEPEDAVAFVNYMLGQVQEPVDEVTVDAIAQILGVDLAIGEDGGVYVPAQATIENVDTSPVEGTTPPEATGGTAEYTTPDFGAIQGTIPPTLTGGTARYTSRSCDYDMTAPTIYGKAVYTKVGPGSANGTAHAEGNAKPSFFQRIKAKIGGAFAGGNWGAPKTETALVGELGPELIVRGSKWFTVGDEGAEFANIRQGDIIFNHRQTEELFKNGYVTSNTGRGNLVGGAFAEGTAYNKSNNRWGEGSGGSLRVTQYAQNQAAQQAAPAQQTAAAAAQQAEEETKETIDWIEVLISRIERVIDVLDTKASSAFRKWGDRMDDLGEQFAKVTEEIEIQRKAYEQYCARAASLGLDETYAKKVRDGEMSIEDLMIKVNQNAQTEEEKKTLKDIIDEYQNWYEKALQTDTTIAKLQVTLGELAKSKFDQTLKKWELELKSFDTTISMTEKHLEHIADKGMFAGKAYYEDLVDLSEVQARYLQEKYWQLVAKRNEAIESGTIENMSEADLEMKNEIWEVEEAWQEATNAIQKYKNEWLEMDTTAYEWAMSQVDNLHDEAEFIRSLLNLSENWLYNKDTGRFTESGLVTGSLHAMDYDLYMAQADEYKKKALELQKAVKLEPNNTKLIDQYNEYIKKQREAIKNANDEKKAVKDLVSESYKRMLDALQKLINKRKEYLNGEKDLYDYQKQIEKQTKTINDYEKQLLALKGDNSEEARAKRQEISENLKDAKDELEASEYDKYLRDQEQLMDNMYDEFERVLNERLDEIDGLLQDMIDWGNSNTSTINATIQDSTRAVGYNISDGFKKIWDNSSNNAVYKKLAMYDGNFSCLTTINKTVSDILNSLKAKTETKNNTPTLSNTVTMATGKKQASTTTTTKKSPAPAPAPSFSVGGKINATNAPIYATSTGGVGSYGTHQYFSNDPYYIVTDIKGDYLLVKHHKGTQPIGWFKKTDVTPMATGGYTGDQEGMALLHKKERVLSAQQTAAFEKLVNDYLPMMTQQLMDNSKIGDLSKAVTVTQHNTGINGDVTLNFNLPDVTDASGFVNELRNNKEFTQLVEHITFDKMTGKSSLRKNLSRKG